MKLNCARRELIALPVLRSDERLQARRMLLVHRVGGCVLFERAWGDPGKIIAPACPILWHFSQRGVGQGDIARARMIASGWRQGASHRCTPSPTLPRAKRGRGGETPQSHRNLIAALTRWPRSAISRAFRSDQGAPKMSRRCQITGKGVLSGNNVSHANNKTRRRFLPNLQDTSLLSDILACRGPHAAVHPRDPHGRTQRRHRRLSARHAGRPAYRGRQGAEAPAASARRPSGLPARRPSRAHRPADAGPGRGASCAQAGIDNPRWKRACWWPTRWAPRLRRLLRDPRRPGRSGPLEPLLRRRIAHEPLALILGQREFWSLDFAVSPATLIPRPESETLIEAALAAFADRPPPRLILDLGTGTGCLLLAALSEFPPRSALAWTARWPPPRWPRAMQRRWAWPTAPLHLRRLGRRAGGAGSISSCAIRPTSPPRRYRSDAGGGAL